MKIALIAPTYLPARRANTIQVMKMAQAIAGLGHEVHVFVPDPEGRHRKARPAWDEVARHYGLAREFPITWLPTAPAFKSYDFGWRAARAAENWGANIIYTRHPQAAAAASLRGRAAILEVHDIPQGAMGPLLFQLFLRGRGARKIVMITRALRDALKPENWISSIETLVLPDGVDLERYREVPGPEEARTALDIPGLRPGTFTAGYTGHLYAGRGADLILEMAARLPGVQFLLVGGSPEDLERVRTKTRHLENVLLAGFVPNADLPRYQAACEVLLMPYQRQVAASSGGDIARYLSPMKLFEYLACGRAILSSNLPVLLEVLNPENSMLLPPDDVETWADAIKTMQQDPALRHALGMQARQDAARYSWDARAAQIFGQNS